MPVHLKRISAIASLVEKGSRVADIGADHGRLSIFLRQNNIAKSVIATDLRQKPLQNAVNNIQKANIDGIQTRLCDGFDAILPDEIDTAVIAGMGGEIIAGIIDRAPFVAKNKIKLVLQPMSSAEALRKYLLENGFFIGTELTVEEDGKIYTVIPAVFDGKTRKADLFYLYAGERDFSTSEAKEYLRKLYKRIKGERPAFEKENKLDHYAALCERLENIG